MQERCLLEHPVCATISSATISGGNAAEMPDCAASEGMNRERKSSTHVAVDRQAGRRRHGPLEL